MARRDQMDATLAIAVFSVAFIAHDGETNWMEGVQLRAVYAILVLGFYFLPAGIS
jgi:Ca2+:H+ antiporter